MNNFNEGADKLIAGIIEEANADAVISVQDGEKKAEAIMAKGNADAERIVKDADATAKRYDAEVLLRNRTNAELDAKKQILQTKRELLDEVFGSAHEKLCKKDEKYTSELLKRLLLNEAEGGETVFPSKRHRSTIEKLMSAPEIQKLGLSLSDKDGAVETGFIIASPIYRKNCSYESILAELREREESSVASILFAKAGKTTKTETR